jgi:Nucleotidyltransferase domain
MGVSMPTPATITKRQELLAFIEQVVRPIKPVAGIVAIGSLANGTARADSDLDLVAFLSPFDAYALPAEAIWRASDQSFHSIFQPIDGLQIDIHRVGLDVLIASGGTMPEGRRAELATGWLAFDRADMLAPLLAEWTRYDDATQITRLDEAVTWLDQHLGEDAPQLCWETLGPLIAHDRLSAAYTYLVQGLFALNRRWQPWRNREIDALLRLPTLPDQFATRMLTATYLPSDDDTAYTLRVQALRGLMADLLELASIAGVYTDDPVDQAFIRSHAEPGRAWNMAEWEAEHQRRYRTPTQSAGELRYVL